MSLPAELIDLVIGSLPQHDQTSCARVSRSFHHSAVQALYRNVCFDSAWQGSLNRQAVNSPLPDFPTRVRQTTSFCRTIKESRLLLELIKTAFFLLNGASREAVRENVAEILELFSKLREPPYVHLSSLISSQWSALARYPQLVSIRLKVDIHCRPGHYESLMTAFSLDHIVSITISGIKTWNHADYDHHPAGEDPLVARERFSPVKSLAILDSCSPGQELADLLAWPCALEKFVYESKVMNSPFDIAYPFSPALFSPVLSAQADHLQEIYLSLGPTSSFSPHVLENTVLLSLRHFRQLKRFGAPCEYLMVFSNSSGDYGRTVFAPPLHEMLPSSLEQLQICLIHTRQTRRRAFNVDSERSSSAASLEFIDWLAALPPKSTKHLPRLRRVACWWRRSSHRQTLQSPEGLPWGIAQPRSGSVPLQELFGRANINLSFEATQHPPLFGVSPG